MILILLRAIAIDNETKEVKINFVERITSDKLINMLCKLTHDFSLRSHGFTASFICFIFFNT